MIVTFESTKILKRILFIRTKYIILFFLFIHILLICKTFMKAYDNFILFYFIIDKFEK